MRTSGGALLERPLRAQRIALGAGIVLAVIAGIFVTLGLGEDLDTPAYLRYQTAGGFALWASIFLATSLLISGLGARSRA